MAYWLKLLFLLVSFNSSPVFHHGFALLGDGKYFLIPQQIQMGLKNFRSDSYTFLFAFLFSVFGAELT